MVSARGIFPERIGWLGSLNWARAGGRRKPNRCEPQVVLQITPGNDKWGKDLSAYSYHIYVGEGLGIAYLYAWPNLVLEVIILFFKMLIMG